MGFFAERLEKEGAVLAPMASFTDAPFRLVSERFGALWTVAEMVMSRSLLEGAPVARELIEFHPEEHSRIIQLAGSDPAEVAAAAELAAAQVRPRAIDLNMGCPMPKIVSRGAGAALLDDPGRAARMVTEVRQATGLPVSVKLRLGNHSTNAPAVARELEAAGAELLRVHGRTAAQRYGGRADWGGIAAVARAVGIPVVGSGDVRSVRDYREKRGLGLGVAVARGALGRPWFFAEVRGVAVAPQEKRRATLEHLHLHLGWYAGRGRRWALRAFRGHLQNYLAAALPDERRNLLRSEDAAEVAAALNEWVGRTGFS